MLTGLADGLDVGCESKTGVKDESKVSGLNNWKRFVNKGGWGGENGERSGMGKGELGAQF